MQANASRLTGDDIARSSVVVFGDFNEFEWADFEAPYKADAQRRMASDDNRHNSHSSGGTCIETRAWVVGLMALPFNHTCCGPAWAGTDC